MRSSDEVDEVPLVKGHEQFYLILEEMTTILCQMNYVLNSCLQQLLSQFWNRLSSEVVARQERAKLSVDDVVLITGEGIPPLQWSIGRVM